MKSLAHSSAPSIQGIKQAMRATWMSGDFGMVAKTIASVGEEFVARLPIPPGARVLDVACGTGNLAIPIARRGAISTGVDIATNLLEQARERAKAAGVHAIFDEGDAEELPYADASFDIVVSMFGAMFAPRPELVAAELARVLKPGGLLAMANWNAEGFSGLMFQAHARHVPPPPGVPPPLLWGNEGVVRERLSGAFHEVRTEVIPMDFGLPTDPAGAVAFFRQYFGPTLVAFSKLDPAGQAALAAELESLWHRHNVAPDPTRQTLVHNQYLQVTARRNLGPVRVA